MKLCKRDKGFTLIEVMIALAIFAVFITAFVASQGSNLVTSARLRNELILHGLAQDKINEVIVSPPELTERLELTPVTGRFEDNEEYTFTITYQRFIIPDLARIQGQSNQQNQQESQMAQLEQRLFNTVKENMERLLWQVEVKVTSTVTQEEYFLTTWLYNHQAEVSIGGF